MLVDISDIKKDLNEEEKEIFDKVIKAVNTKSITVNMLNLAFAVILLYVCFTILPLWAAISLIGIKLAIPIAELVKYIIIAKKLIKDDKDANKKILSILDRIGDIIGNGCTTDIESDKAEHNMPETEKYFYRLTKSNN